VAWMRMMGRESVEYHRATVLERGDDYPGMALAYYASRGETPLVWGGSGAYVLGLSGTVRVWGVQICVRSRRGAPPRDQGSPGIDSSSGDGAGDFRP
jgi:hypothetical protein